MPKTNKNHCRVAGAEGEVEEEKRKTEDSDESESEHCGGVRACCVK